MALRGSLSQQALRETLKIGDVRHSDMEPLPYPADHRGVLKTLHRKSDGLGGAIAPAKSSNKVSNSVEFCPPRFNK